MSFESNFRKIFSEVLSKKGRKELPRLSQEIGEIPALALLGSKQNSINEVRSIAYIISIFRDIRLYAYKTSPYKAILEARTAEGCKVLIHPQYMVRNPVTGGYYKLDLTVELYAYQHSEIMVGAWAMEYDEFPTHFTSEGIKADRFKDLMVQNESDINTIHLTPENWEKHPSLYRENLELFIERKLLETSSISIFDLKAIFYNRFQSPELIITSKSGKVLTAKSWELADNN